MYIGIVVALRLGQHLGTILQSVFPPIMSDMRNMKERLLIIERSFCLLFSQNTSSVSGTPNYNKPLSYSGGYIGKYGLTFYFFSVKESGFAYVIGGWNERKGGNTEWDTPVYRMSTNDFEAHLHYVSRFDITDNLAKYAKRITVTSGALFFVEPGYVYVWCSQGSLPTVYAMN